MTDIDEAKNPVLRSLTRKTGMALICIAATILICLPARGQTNATRAKLAILVAHSSLSPIGDLLTAELSRRNDLQLLEREQIDKVYQEQALSATSTDYVKLGQVLGADGLYLMEKSVGETKDHFATRLIAVKPGVVLTSDRFDWPITNGAAWSKEIGEHLGPFIPKLTVLVGDAVPISIVSLRSAVQSEEAREYERQLTLLTAERLSREQHLFVLERREMDTLSQENALNGLDDSAFWSGSYVLQGTIDRDGYSPDTVTLDASLTPAKGGTPQAIHLSANRTDVSTVVNVFAEKILAELKVTQTSPAWDPKEEATQFLADAQWAYRWGLFPQARAASDAAWTLGLKTKEVATYRAAAYAGGVWEFYENINHLEIPRVPDPAALPLLAHALEIYRDGISRYFTNNEPLDDEWFYLGDKILYEATAILDGFYHTAELRQSNEAPIAKLRLAARETGKILPNRIPQNWISNGLVSMAQVRTKYNDGPAFNFSANNVLNVWNTFRWAAAAVWFEHPEDPLPLFRQMIETGYM